jgi:hypothetical protein
MDRASWEAAVGLAGGTFADLSDLGTQVPDGSTLTGGTPITLPITGTLSFGTDLFGAQVPTSWLTWNPLSINPTPAVLDTFGGNIVTGAFSGAIMAFGLEMEPNEFASHDMTLALSDATSLQLSVDGNAGAMFFGWVGQAITGMTLSCDDCDAAPGFAFGNMVQGNIPTATVAEPATLALFGLGLAGLAFARRRKTA